MYQSELWFIILWILLCVAFAFIGYVFATILEKNNIARKCLMVGYTSSIVCSGYTGLLIFSNAIGWLVQHGYLLE
ncbi:MAG: hypothetical protein K2P99_07655 [Burkholderiales bacterium]|nr:hypothetical protein [Burkholderiales bacterium]